MKSREDKIKGFNPNDMSKTGSGIFGLPFTTGESDIVILPIPWDVTASYKKGTAGAPKKVLEASGQVDLYDSVSPELWKRGIAMEQISKEWQKKNTSLRKKSDRYLKSLEAGKNSPSLVKILREINSQCFKLNEWVKREALNYLKENKFVMLLGGEHSVSYGMIKAMTQTHNDFGILQIDAHHDLRENYEGFEYSHASIMWNALKFSQVSKLVSVGVRDYSQSEAELVKKFPKRIFSFYYKDISRYLSQGKTWDYICKKIVSQLPKKVYITFDIDGLEPKNCPNTGTPVPGGLEYEQAIYLIEKVVESDREIIGFDLVEVGAEEWDANVASRLIYRLLALFVKSPQKLYNSSHKIINIENANRQITEVEREFKK